MKEINDNFNDYISDYKSKDSKKEKKERSESKDEKKVIKMHESPIKKPKIEKDNAHGRLKEILKQLEKKIHKNEYEQKNKKNDSEISYSKVICLFKGLRSYISNEEHKDPKCSLDKICDYLQYLVPFSPENSLIESSKVLKVLKVFNSENNENPNKSIKLLAEISLKLYLY